MPTVVAVDVTVAYASMVLIRDGETPQLAYRVTKGLDDPNANARVDHHPAAEMRKNVEFASVVVDAVTKLKPDLVVLRQPGVGTIVSTQKSTRSRTQKWNVTGDSSAIRRMGVHWKIVELLDTAGVPVAEASVEAVSMMVLGKLTRGYAEVADACMALYPAAQPPSRDGKPDPRFRMTTLGLALIGAIAAGIDTPITVDDRVLDAISRGTAFPPRFRVPRAGEDYIEHAALRRRNTAAARTEAKAKRAESWYETQLEAIRTLPVVELRDKGRPKNPVLRREWDARMRAADEPMVEV
ncbi:hypothetical protein I3U40_18180 [Mycobacteroides abscessus subsp. abscessus]|uniref:hypothetical protein n=1 Tax=Mycobacteroides abscessus TaxID=36809 RepID=UPI0009A69C6A|nr:hypothetical protein [Mycobacteroides abscessus]QSM92985.1 hypothetical protein I3U31_18170 [Mycobacteroides abscessus subsp. abscessus]QSM98023.1 hypothetical protein I3U40_18180 [Mycobacteroides abscessus subsp. abscessus]SLI41003.1 Uncharacterised protein [Mycobacteroides abscessus subsp. abscessus]